MELNIALLPGDGIGPEVIDQAVKVSNAIAIKFNHTINWTPALTGADAIDKVGDPYPEKTHNICMQSDAILFGAIGHPKYDNDPSAKIRPEQGLLKMRQKLGLFANVRPTFTFPSLINKSPLKKLTPVAMDKSSATRTFSSASPLPSVSLIAKIFPPVLEPTKTLPSALSAN